MGVEIGDERDVYEILGLLMELVAANIDEDSYLLRILGNARSEIHDTEAEKGERRNDPENR